MFQSTHPHGVRHYKCTRSKFSTDVSIHAPTRGATGFVGLSSSEIASFNPRTHTGCDLRICASSLATISVSIHAPTRGATEKQNQWNIDQWFQSTHPHGVRPSVSSAPGDINTFQSTHPHGVRQNGDLLKFIVIPVSIHAPTRGATSCDIFKLDNVSGFNPRTHTGCDQLHQHLYQ